MKQKSTLYILFFILGFAPTLVAQKGIYRFESFPADNTLSHASVISIYQDHDGFLWLGTWAGLMKYDGYQVKQYKREPGDVNGLESIRITAIFEDSQHRLWVGTRNSGLYLYERSEDHFLQFINDAAVSKSLSNNNVWAVYEDSFGGIWVGTEQGLNRFLPDQMGFTQFIFDSGADQNLNSDFVNTIAESQDGILWVGTEAGLRRLVRGEDGRPLHFISHSVAPEQIAANTETFISHNYIYEIVADATPDPILWVGTKAGLKKMRFTSSGTWKTETYQHTAGDEGSLSHNYVVDIQKAPDGDLWLATFDGLNLFDPARKRFTRFMSDINQPNSLKNHFIWSLFLDRNQILWIGTEGGLHKLNLSSKPFLSVTPDVSKNASNANITSLVPSSNSEGLWLATRGSGLNYMSFTDQKDTSFPFRHFTFNTAYASESAGLLSDLVVDQEGWLWITTHGAGVLKVKETDLLSGDFKDDQVYQYAVSQGLDNLDKEHLMSIMSAQNGDLWMGGWDIGLVRYDRRTGQFVNYETTAGGAFNLQTYPNVYLLESLEDGAPVLWLGSRGGGLLKLRYRPEKDDLQLLEHYQYQPNISGGLSNNYVNCLFIDARQRLWVGTGNGLNLLDKQSNTFTFFLEKDGLANSTIQSIEEGAQNEIWISSHKGISCLTPEEDGTYQIKNFDVHDGLQDNFFNDDASTKTASGQLVFGGIKGLNIFDTQDIELDSVPPTVIITDLKLFNESVPIAPENSRRILLEKSISETDHIDLTHRDKVISFEFTGLHLANPQKNQYAHQLEGFNSDWVYTNSSQRIAHYTNLSSGDYIFKVKAANGDGVWSDPIALKITVHPPFWLTYWAYLLYACSFFAILWAVWKITKRQTDLKHKWQLERIEREKLEEVNQMKSSFFTNISHELRTPLTLILGPLEQMIKEKGADKKQHKTYTLMHRNANRLLTMINQLLDLRKNEAGLMKLQAAEGNIVKFVHEVILSFKGLATQEKIHLKFSPEKDHIPLWYDRDQMEKVLFNLLSNAFKHTPKQGTIEVRIQEDPNSSLLLLSVKDTGTGIPQNQLDAIFDRFYQIENNPEAVGKGGTGIGLALSKSIVEAHRGKIWAESPALGIEGKGAVFYVQIPVGSDHFTEEEKIPDFQDSETISHYFLSKSPLDHHPSLSTEDQPPILGMSGQKPLLLIVEDNQDIRSYLKEYLKKQYKIEEASDGDEGLKKALAAPPDLIIADISMPKMDGIEMCAKVKSSIQTSHIPVILLTARTSLLYKIDGLETGADDYMTKPFNINLLASRIRNLIESRRKLREKFANNFDLSPSGIVINSLDEKLLSSVKQLVEKHIDNSDFSTEQLATSLHMSRMQLYRKLKSLTGKSPNQVIRNIRLQRAAQLLKTRQYNVSDVTYMVGYNDLKWFREQFKKEFGVSPSNYEKHFGDDIVDKA